LHIYVIWIELYKYTFFSFYHLIGIIEFSHKSGLVHVIFL